MVASLSESSEKGKKSNRKFGRRSLHNVEGLLPGKFRVFPTLDDDTMISCLCNVRVYMKCSGVDAMLGC